MDTPANAGGIDFETFIDAITSRKTDHKTKDGIYKVFKLFDVDGNEKISGDNLSKVFSELGEDMSEGEIQEIMDRSAATKEAITFDEFYNVLTRKGAH
mmetsp:Transcript_6619/g.3741  ORF Transcript_6619/g.3741 Transcript_6619/m.3741 type:complete len:98 (+) Transcript_6619:266-559(+)